jgi:hypothetical protein
VLATCLQEIPTATYVGPPNHDEVAFLEREKQSIARMKLVAVASLLLGSAAAFTAPSAQKTKVSL